MSTFGGYERRGTLGAGGYATVYRAWDRARGREVALKVLNPDVANDPEVRRRLRSEAQNLNDIGHANIVRVYEAGEAGGVPYIAMELIEGLTLRELLDRERSLSLARVLAMLRGLCDALDYLHASGIVHRDVTARNVMLEAGGRPVLMDFGIARALDEAHFTRSGRQPGTPIAMAPEQARGDEVGPPADIYALGVLTFQLLAGRPPFTGHELFVLHCHLYVLPPDLGEFRPDLPGAVCRAVGRALEKQPEWRQRSAGELLRELAAPPATPSTVTPTPIERTDRRRPRVVAVYVAVALASIILVVGVGLIIHWQSSSQTVVATAEVTTSAPPPAAVVSVTATGSVPTRPGPIVVPSRTTITTTAIAPPPTVVSTTAAVTPPGTAWWTIHNNGDNFPTLWRDCYGSSSPYPSAASLVERIAQLNPSARQLPGPGHIPDAKPGDRLLVPAPSLASDACRHYDIVLALTNPRPDDATAATWSQYLRRAVEGRQAHLKWTLSRRNGRGLGEGRAA